MKISIDNPERAWHIHHFPYPIANSAYRLKMSVEHGRSPFECYRLLIDAFDHSLIFLNTVLLAGMSLTETEQPHFERIVGELTGTSKPLSMGVWTSHLRTICKVGHNSKENAPFNDILKAGPSICQIYEGFVPDRNAFSHETAMPDAELTRFFNRGLSAYLELIELIRPLEQYTLCVASEINGPEIEIYECMGCQLPFRKMTMVFDVSVRNLKELESFILTPSGAIVPLGPFAVYISGVPEIIEHCNFFLFDKTKRDKNRFTKLQLKGLKDTSRLYWSASNILLHKLMDEDCSVHRHSQYLDILNHYHFLFELESCPEDDEEKAALEQEKRDYCFPYQKDIIKGKLQGFVGRTATFNTISNYVSNLSQGYILIEGEPGQGKSAMMSYLVDKHDYIYHFIAREDGRNHPEKLLRSLLCQLKIRYALDLVMADVSKMDYEELVRVFLIYLQDAAVNARMNKNKDDQKVVICLDALDEMEGDQSLGFLPEHLPDNVIFIITSRPSQKHVEVLSKVASNDVYTLPPLSTDEFMMLVKQQGMEDRLTAADVAAIYDKCSGNTMFMKYTLIALQRNEIDINGIPADITVFYDRILVPERMREPKLYTNIRNIIGVLCVARAGLTINDLAGVIGIHVNEGIYEAINEIRAYLACEDDHYRLYHKLMADHYLNPKRKTGFSPEDVKQLHRMIIKRFERLDDDEYAQQNLFYHFYETADYDGCIALMDRIEEDEYPIIYAWLGMYSAGGTDKRYKKLKKHIEQGTSIKANAIFANHLYFISRFSEAAGLINRVLDSAPSDDLEIRHHMVLRLAWCYYEMAQVGNMQAVIDAHLKGQALETSVQEKLMNVEATIYHETGRLCEAVEKYNLIKEQAARARRTFEYESQLGQAYYLMGRYHDALSCHRKSLEEHRSHYNKILLARDHGNIGLVTYFSGDIETGLEQQKAALELYGKYNYNSGISMYMRNQGCILALAADYPGAIDCFSEAEDIDKVNDQKYGQADCKNNLGAVYMQMGDLAKARDYSQTAEAINDEIAVYIEGERWEANTGGINSARANLALIDICEGKWQRGIESLHAEMKAFKLIPLGEEVILSGLNIAVASYFAGDHVQAHRWALESYSVAQETGLKLTALTALNLLCQLEGLLNLESEALGHRAVLDELRIDHELAPHLGQCEWTTANLHKLVVPFYRFIEYY